MTVTLEAPPALEPLAAPLPGASAPPELALGARPGRAERFPNPDVVAWSQLDGDTGVHLRGELPALRRGLAVVICTYRRAESLERCLRSLATQRPQPDALLVVDASPDAASEEATARVLEDGALPPTTYLRVTGSLKGLTRQRNLALSLVEHDLVAFFDDDVVFEPGCLGALEGALRENPRAAGAGVVVVNESPRPNALWRARRLLGIVPRLTPGRYTKGGMSIPWSFLETRGRGVVEGDFLPGCGMAFRTAAARATRFHDGFAGYGQGEDLDFSLRMRRHGALLLACDARLVHLTEPEGRPDAERLGYMAIRNRWEIQGRSRTRTRGDALAFLWTWGMDSLLMARHLLIPSRVRRTLGELRGRARAALEILRGRA